MDIDVFPNSIEYWGPTGMVFFRNVQVRWMPIQGDTRLTLALERPGASADAGVLADRIEIQNVTGRFPIPDFSGEYRWAGIGATSRARASCATWKSTTCCRTDNFDRRSARSGWGVNLSSNLKPWSAATFRLQFVFGEGIQNYMNDAPVDVAIERNPRRSAAADPRRGAAAGRLCRVLWITTGAMSGARRSVTRFWTSTTPKGRTPMRSTKGHYALVNLLHYPGEERDGRYRVAVGQARELPRRLHLGRLPNPVLLQIQLLGDSRRAVRERAPSWRVRTDLTAWSDVRVGSVP